MRLFVGLDLPADSIRTLDAFQARLRPLARLSWSPAANLHITTKFIGEWPEERLEEVKTALRALTPRPPIDIRIQGLGFFPHERAPRVFWAGIEAPPELAMLARDTDEALGQLGVARETRPFAPHLTLARIRHPVPLDRLLREIAAARAKEFGRFTAREFFLYLSKPAPGGSVYTKLAEFPFS